MNESFLPVGFRDPIYGVFTGEVKKYPIRFQFTSMGKSRFIAPYLLHPKTRELIPSTEYSTVPKRTKVKNILSTPPETGGRLTIAGYPLSDKTYYIKDSLNAVLTDGEPIYEDICYTGVIRIDSIGAKFGIFVPPSVKKPKGSTFYAPYSTIKLAKDGYTDSLFKLIGKVVF